MVELKVIDGNAYEYESLEVAHERAPGLVGRWDGSGKSRTPTGVHVDVFSDCRTHGEVSPTKRTRWLAFLNERGKLVYAPAVRTFQLALLLGMGREWFERALALPSEPIPVAVLGGGIATFSVANGAQ